MQCIDIIYNYIPYSYIIIAVVDVADVVPSTYLTIAIILIFDPLIRDLPSTTITTGISCPEVNGFADKLN